MKTKRLLIVLAFAWIAACSSDDGVTPDPDNNGGGGGGGATQSDSAWVEDIGSLASQMEQWVGDGADSIAARSLAYLQSLPTVADAGIFPGTTTVWANFANGYDLVIPNNREPSSMADTLIDEAHAPAPRAPAAPRKVTIPQGRAMMKVLTVPDNALEIPESPQFRAVNAIGTCHVNPLPGIRSVLTAGNYVNANPPLPTVAGLRNSVHGDGVFYINSHGGPGFDANQQPFYAVWTLDPVDPAAVANYRSMLVTHELVGMIEYSNDALGNCLCVMHYGFTDKFVRNRMSFEKNSLVIVDACYSGTAPAEPLRQAFRAVGASAYVGWSDRVDAPFAYKAMKYLLDRMLGINRISPETPKQRAFNIDDIRADMAANRNLVADPAFGGVLTVFKLKDDFGLLAPSIQFLSIEGWEDGDHLLIAGMFGTDPGDGKRKVSIDGQSLDVISWQPTLIECDLPDDAAGTVVVEFGEGSSPRRSNEVNLTKWELQLDYERDDPGSQRVDMTLQVNFRADVHAFRDMPHEQPWETTVLFSAMRDASGSISTSGTVSQSTPPCSDTFTMSGGLELPRPGETLPEGGWTYLGSVDSQSHTLQLNMSVFTLFSGATWTHSGPTECAPFSIPLYLGVRIEDCLFDDLTGLTAFRMQMDSDFSIMGDNRGPCTVAPLIAPLADQSAQAQIRWGQASAQHPPDPEAAR